tara:strand:+ start:2828 stop:3586 length:759 start_codon:yes stop_codon:yes gene_type:complete
MQQKEEQLNSYIKLFRKAKKNPLFKKPYTFHYFTYCLLSAWWSDEPTKFDLGGVEVLIRKGEFATTLRRSAYETGLSIQNVRTAIKTLKLTNVLTEDLTRGLTNGGRVLKVCKYSVYQAKKTEANKPTNRPTNRPVNKQIKKVKEEGYKKPPISPPRGNFKDSHRSKIRNPGLFRQLIKGYLNVETNDKSLDERINEKYKLNRTAKEATEELQRETSDKGRTRLGRSSVKDSQVVQNADNGNTRRQRRVQNK